MLIRFDRTGAERKALVAAISEITGDKARYMGAPNFAYSVNGHAITKDGTLETGGLEDVVSLLSALEERGIVPVEAPELSGDDAGRGAPDVMVVELPDDGLSDLAFDNLTKLVAGKATLIRKAVGDCLAKGAEALPVIRENGKICFPWFRFGMEANEVAAWARFVGALVGTAKAQKRVILKEKPLEEGASEKFAMRCYLLKLGFIGEEYKEARKVILAGLPGDGSRKRGKEDAAPAVSDDLAKTVETDCGEDGVSPHDCLSCAVESARNEA